MWICRTLIDQVDRAALDAVAQVSETNDAFKITLREGQRLDDLELALRRSCRLKAHEYRSSTSAA
jgi:hypothetical protein